MSASQCTIRHLRIGSKRLLTAFVLVLLEMWFLFPRAASAQINVRVRAIDTQTNETIDRVKVEIVLFPSTVVRTEFTDGNGWVEFLNVKPDVYTLRATKSEYQPFQDSLDLNNLGPNPAVDVRLRPLDSKAEPRGGTVSARFFSIPEKARKEFQTGMVLLGEKNDAKASIDHFRKAIAAFPAYYEAYYLLGMAQLKTGNESDGETSLRKSVELNPQFLDPYYPLAELLIRLKRYSDAEQMLQTPYQEDPQNWKWPYELAMCYDKLGQLEKGIVLAQAALERKDAPSKIRLLLANLYENSGQLAKAVAELEEFKKQDPENPMVPKVNLVLEQLRATIQSSGKSTPTQ